MQLTSQLDLLHQQLNIASDNHSYILPTLCRNFLRKYQNRPHLHLPELSNDLKNITAQIDLYSQYTYETIVKYQSLHKLQVLVRAIIESQSSLITYMTNQISQTLGQRFNSENKIQAMINRVYQRCQTCTKPLRRANVEAIQDQMGLKFKDLYNYFMHDMDEISRLSEEASLIFRKKMLNIQGIAEEEYMQKFEKMYENVSTTIDHVTASLSNITKFQQKFRELQDHQPNGQDRMLDNKFDSKKYAINLSKHFNGKIQHLKAKLDRIKTFFVNVTANQSQTQVDFTSCSPQRIEELEKQIVDMEQDKKQAEIYSKIIDKQIKQDRSKFKNLQNTYSALKAEKQKFQEKARKLQIQLIFVKDRYEMPSQNKFETDKKNNEILPKAQGTKQLKEQLKSSKKLKSKKMIETPDAEEQQTTKEIDKEQIRNALQKKVFKHPSFNPNLTSKNELEIGERDLNMKVYMNRKMSKLKTDQYFELTKQKLSNQRKAKVFSQNQENINGQNPKFIKENKYAQLARENTEGQTNSVEQQSQESQLEPISSVKKIFTIEKQTEIKILPSGSGKKQNSNYMKRKFFEKLLPSQSEESNVQKNTNEQTTNQYFLQKIYNNNQSLLRDRVSLRNFKERIEGIIKELVNRPRSDSQNKKDERSRSKSKSLSRISIQLKKDTLAEAQHRFSGLADKQTMAKMLMKRKTSKQRSKINTETSYEDPQKIMNARQTLRKSINGLDETQNGEKFLLRMQKFNCFSNTDTFINNKTTLQNLPLLKKKNKYDEQNAIDTAEMNELQLAAGLQKQQFTQKDLRIVFHTVQNAYEFGRLVFKHKKSQSCILGEDDLMHSSEMGYIKQFFALMANVHLNNKEAYDRIRLFIVSPYDSTITQMTQLNLIKSGSSSNAMRESLKKIVLLHRNCVTRNEICKHLKYLLAKVACFTANKQNNQS